MDVPSSGPYLCTVMNRSVPHEGAGVMAILHCSIKICEHKKFDQEIEDDYM